MASETVMGEVVRLLHGGWAGWPGRVSALRAVLAAASLLASASAAEFRFGDLPLTVPDGFVVERVAGPPLVERPVTIAFDGAGRLYVAESSGSNAALAQQQQDPKHRVLRLEDSDGDGVFDRRTVFADSLMMLQGTLWHAGSLYVAAAPEILKLTDTDGDGVADERAVWHDGGTLTGCGNDLHGPYLAPDGRIEFTKGAFAEQIHDLVGRPGWTTRASHVFRCRHDGSELEAVVTGGMDNPVDVAFTSRGERLLSATFLAHPAGGLRDGVVHAVEGGTFGKEHGVLDGHARSGDLLPVMLHLGPAAACGLHVHSGFGLGEAFADNAFVCGFNLRSVSRHRLMPQGGSFRVESEPFLSGDSADFHPTDVIEDADGSLLVVDTGGWYKLCCPTSQLEKPAVTGAIYRIRKTDGQAASDPRGLRLPWSDVSGDALAARLGDPRPAVAQRAVEQLAARGASEPLAGVVASTAFSEAARQRAVWGLARIDGPDARAAVRRGLADADAGVRQAAAHVAGLHRDAEAVPLLVAILQDDTPAVARAAAEALGRIGDEPAVAAVLAACERPSDRMTEHTLIHALIESATTDALTAALDNPTPGVRRAAIVALDQRPLRHAAAAVEDDARLRAAVVAAATDADHALRETALWVIGSHPAWATDLAAAVPELIAAAAREERTGSVPSPLTTRLARLAGNPAIADALADACRGAAAEPGKVTAAALDVMRAAEVEVVPDRWALALTDLLGDAMQAAATDPSAEANVAAIVRTLAALPLSAQQRDVLSLLLCEVAADSQLSPSLSLAALAARGTVEQLPPPVVARLIAIVTVEPLEEGDAAGISPLDRSAAAEALATLTLDEPQRMQVADAVARLPAGDVARLLPLLTAAGGPPLVRGIEVLTDATCLASLPQPVVMAAVEALPADTQAVGQRLLQAYDIARRATRHGYDRLLASLPEGDATRGHRVFLSNKAACITCHAMAYAGGRIGPDLTRIGSIRTREDLLEAILLPSASFVRSYEPVTVLTMNGRSIPGIIREENDREVVVQTSATAEERVARDEIDSIHPGTASLMPSGYEMLLTPQEIADLVAFLERAR